MISFMDGAFSHMDLWNYIPYLTFQLKTTFLNVKANQYWLTLWTQLSWQEHRTSQIGLIQFNSNNTENKYSLVLEHANNKFQYVTIHDSNNNGLQRLVTGKEFGVRSTHLNTLGNRPRIQSRRQSMRQRQKLRNISLQRN